MRLLSGILLPILASPAWAQTTWFVDVSGVAPGTGTTADPYTSIQYAIERPTTVNGDRIEVSSGTYVENIDFMGKLITVEGPAGSGPAAVIDGAANGSAVTFRSGETTAAVLRRFTVRGGSGTAVGTDLRGGGVLVDAASPTLAAVLFVDNSADLGGAVACVGGAPTLVDCVFADNVADRGGGLHVEGGVVDLAGGEFTGNRTNGGSGQGGGGIWVGSGGALDGSSIVFHDNRALGGGAVGTSGDSAGTVLRDCTFTRNAAGTFFGPGRGGAVRADGPFLAEQCAFRENGEPVEFDAHLSGGAGSGGDYVDSVFERNGAQLGGALSFATATRCTFIDNSGCADGSGRGGAAEDSTLVDCTLVDNWTCGEGGAAYGSTLARCVVHYNYAVGTSAPSPAYGGGLASCSASGCSIVGNEARASHGFGSGLPSEGGGAFGSDLDRCIVVGNFAERGGGVAGFGFGGPTVDRSTIVGNQSTLESAGVFAGTFTNSIVWHNIGDSGVGTATFTYSNVDVTVAGTGNISAPPELFGRAGSDVHLMATSPCIDAGDPAAPLDPDGSRADMGALPFDATWSAAPAPYCRPTRPWGDPCLALIGAQGQASLSGATTLTVTASGVPPGRLAMLFVGLAPDAYFVPNAASSDGVVCIGMPLVRIRPQTSSLGPGSCGGTLAETLVPADLSGLGLMAGDQLYAQFWYRQPAGFALTNALEIPIRP